MSDVTGWILASVAVLGLTAAIIRWFYFRGGEERELTIAVRENTKATKDLSEGFTVLRDFTIEQLHQLRLEQKEIVHRVSLLEKGGSVG